MNKINSWKFKMIKMRKNYNGDFITSIFIKVVRFKMSRKVSTEIVYQQLSENCIFMVSTFEYKCFENVHKIIQKCTPEQITLYPLSLNLFKTLSRANRFNF